MEMMNRMPVSGAAMINDMIGRMDGLSAEIARTRGESHPPEWNAACKELLHKLSRARLALSSGAIATGTRIVDESISTFLAGAHCDPYR